MPPVFGMRSKMSDGEKQWQKTYYEKIYHKILMIENNRWTVPEKTRRLQG